MAKQKDISGWREVERRLLRSEFSFLKEASWVTLGAGLHRASLACTHLPISSQRTQPQTNGACEEPTALELGLWGKSEGEKWPIPTDFPVRRSREELFNFSILWILCHLEGKYLHTFMGACARVCVPASEHTHTHTHPLAWLWAKVPRAGEIFVSWEHVNKQEAPPLHPGPRALAEVATPPGTHRALGRGRAGAPSWGPGQPGSKAAAKSQILAEKYKAQKVGSFILMNPSHAGSLFRKMIWFFFFHSISDLIMRKWIVLKLCEVPIV